MTPSDVLRKQLVAAQACVEAALALLGETPAPAEGGADVCTHPLEKRRAQPVAGDLDQFLCGACHRLVSGKAGA